MIDTEAGHPGIGMSHKPKLLVTAFALVACCLCASAQAIPNEKAESLAGKKLGFPSVLFGSVATCVFGFGQNSGDKVAVWLESLSSDHINAWSIVNLETVPSVARGALRVSMRIGMPKDLLDRSLVIAKDAKEWKQILEVEKESLPVVALFNKEGNIVWKRQGTFSSSITDELKAKIAALPDK